MELPDHEIERTFQVNILSHYWVSTWFPLINLQSNARHRGDLKIEQECWEFVSPIFLFFFSFSKRIEFSILHLSLQITKSFLKDMMKNNHGHIVTIASVAGLIGTYNCTDYSSTKFAAIGYHESLFAELKVRTLDRNIHVKI